MPHQTPDRNPFMLMLNPEVVLAAIESSERLSKLNRHLCRPLDRPLLGGARPADAAEDDDPEVDAVEPVIDGDVADVTA
jgi:hypothetical protein